MLRVRKSTKKIRKGGINLKDSLTWERKGCGVWTVSELEAGVRARAACHLSSLLNSLYYLHTWNLTARCLSSQLPQKKIWKLLGKGSSWGSLVTDPPNLNNYDYDWQNMRKMAAPLEPMAGKKHFPEKVELKCWVKVLKFSQRVEKYRLGFEIKTPALYNCKAWKQPSAHQQMTG